MKFDGLKFRRTKKVVTLPREYSDGEQKNFVAFGRVCSKDTPNAILTDWTWRVSPYDDGTNAVYALQIPSDGCSLTRLMYGKDGYMYLADDGKVYIRKTRKYKKNYE